MSNIGRTAESSVETRGFPAFVEHQSALNMVLGTPVGGTGRFRSWRNHGEFSADVRPGAKARATRCVYSAIRPRVKPRIIGTTPARGRRPWIASTQVRASAVRAKGPPWRLEVKECHNHVSDGERRREPS